MRGEVAKEADSQGCSKPPSGGIVVMITMMEVGRFIASEKKLKKRWS